VLSHVRQRHANAHVQREYGSCQRRDIVYGYTRRYAVTAVQLWCVSSQRKLCRCVGRLEHVLSHVRQRHANAHVQREYGSCQRRDIVYGYTRRYAVTAVQLWCVSGQRKLRRCVGRLEHVLSHVRQRHANAHVQREYGSC